MLTGEGRKKLWFQVLKHLPPAGDVYLIMYLHLYLEIKKILV